MDKATLVMTASKFNPVRSCIFLAWLNEYQNPDLFLEDKGELMDPFERLLRDIQELSGELERTEIEAEERHLKQSRLDELLRKFASVEALPKPATEYSRQQLWLEAGPKLALQLVHAHIFRVQNAKVPKSRVKDLHRKRARCFDIVKEAASDLEWHFQNFDFPDDDIPEKVVIDFSDNYDLEIIFDVQNSVRLLQEKSEIPSDRAIFFQAKAMLRNPKYVYIQFVDSEIEFSGMSSFKSMERSLAMGRR